MFVVEYWIENENNGIPLERRNPITMEEKLANCGEYNCINNAIHNNCSPSNLYVYARNIKHKEYPPLKELHEWENTEYYGK